MPKSVRYRLLWPIGRDDQGNRVRRPVLVAGEVLDVLMPFDTPVFGGRRLFSCTVQRVPDDVEKLGAAGEVQRGLVPQTDQQRTAGDLLNHEPTGDRYF